MEIAVAATTGTRRETPGYNTESSAWRFGLFVGLAVLACVMLVGVSALIQRQQTSISI
jgi:hypothetical protein